MLNHSIVENQTGFGKRGVGVLRKLEHANRFYITPVVPLAMSTSSPRLVTLLALLGLAPVAYYILGTGRSIVVLSLVSVVVITGSLYLMTGDHESQTA